MGAQIESPLFECEWAFRIQAYVFFQYRQRRSSFPKITWKTGLASQIQGFQKGCPLQLLN